ncbi:MAG TPA: hypothetical protein VFC78_11145 [Tepidisphaeraceae bacterium]|nr:hypothetical protein [Tepidisphaeraceae bacterium]
MKRKVRSAVLCLLLFGALLEAAGCEAKPPPYGTEHQLFLPGNARQVWAVAPAINLSGHSEVDPLIQADLLYAQLQQVHGLTVVPVNRVVEALAGLQIEKVNSPKQAALVCEVLGCDALVVPSITAYDPYNPPKMGAALQLFEKPAGFTRPKNLDVRELSREAAPQPDQALPPPDRKFLQAVGMFDAANGSTRDAVLAYAHGRNDPVGPMGPREYFQSMDRFCGFAYNALAVDLLKQLEAREAAKAKAKEAQS